MKFTAFMTTTIANTVMVKLTHPDQREIPPMGSA